jgi:uncharacterized protein
LKDIAEMELSSSYSKDDRSILLRVASDSIAHGLSNGIPTNVDVADFPHLLQEKAASFVTLKRNGSLRGCIGTLQAIRPLVEDVSENAYAAAFSDPRFPPLSSREFSAIDVSISILSDPEPVVFKSEHDLIDQLRVGIDGLILEEGNQRGTFLPTVWEALPDPVFFFRQLKIKAGLNPEYWSTTLRVFRYHTETIEQT